MAAAIADPVRKSMCMIPLPEQANKAQKRLNPPFRISHTMLASRIWIRLRNYASRTEEVSKPYPSRSPPLGAGEAAAFRRSSRRSLRSTGSAAK